jgi:hypothetical protein
VRARAIVSCRRAPVASSASIRLSIMATNAALSAGLIGRGVLHHQAVGDFEDQRAGTVAPSAATFRSAHRPPATLVLEAPGQNRRASITKPVTGAFLDH